MSDARARDAAIRRELGVPPTFDLVAHVRNLSRVMLPALMIALIAGGAMYLVRGVSRQSMNRTLLPKYKQVPRLSSAMQIWGNWLRHTSPYPLIAQ